MGKNQSKPKNQIYHNQNRLSQTLSLKSQSQDSKFSMIQSIDADQISNQIQNFFKNEAYRECKLSSFTIIGTIYEGGVGDILLVTLKTQTQSGHGQPQQYTIRSIVKGFLKDRKVTIQSRINKQIFDEISSDFILKRIHCFQDKNSLYFLNEYAQGGDCYSLINKKLIRKTHFKNLKEEGIKFILACVILALQEMHSKNIQYRDLKPQHVLIMKNGYIKLKEINISKRQSGALLYFPPEMLAKLPYDKSIDLWMLGVFAYEITIFKPPFKYEILKQNRNKKQKIQQMIEQASIQRVWHNENPCSELKDLINSLLRYDPKQRIGYNNIEQLKNHIFFKNFQWVSLKQFKIKSPLQNLIRDFPMKIQPYNNQ